MDSLAKPTDLDKLDRAIRRSHTIVIIVVLSVIATYLIWFWLIHTRPLSDQSETWGQFGDFVGGVLNPVVAYFAFFWLMRSVRLQKEELYEARQALKDSSEAQQRQAENSQISVRVSALAALVNSIMGEVQMQRLQLQFIVEQESYRTEFKARLTDGTLKKRDELEPLIATINEGITKRLNERYEYEKEIRDLLSRFG